MKTPFNSNAASIRTRRRRIRRCLTGMTLCLVLVCGAAARAQTLYVDQGVPSSGDGASWAQAKKTIGEGIAAASPGTDIHVAQGAYFESVVMAAQVNLYGGYPTGGGARDVDLYETIIDASTARGGLPAYHVVTMDSIVSTALDGFTITGGVADGGVDDDEGAGIRCSNVDETTTVTNCTITGNTAAVRGGGIFCLDSSPRLTNCTISANSGGNGGGIWCAFSWPTVENCTISANSAGTNGGGLCCFRASPAVTDCTIIGNWGGSGGGVRCSANSSPTLSNCTISDNSAVESGGVACELSSPVMWNCAISGNSAVVGGGIACIANSSPSITNCTISANSAASSSNGGGVDCVESSPDITSCTIVGNSAGNGGGVSCREVCSPSIANCTITGNSADYGGGGVGCYSHSSPSITNCAIAGNSVYVDGGGVNCTWSSPAITNCTISGNSAGYGGGICYSDNPTSSVLINCTISDNWATNGGGVFCDRAQPTLANCAITGNSALTLGGGLYVLTFAPSVSNCLFQVNQSHDYYGYFPEMGGNQYWTGAAVINSNAPLAHDNIDGDPMFEMDGPLGIGGTWTAPPVWDPLTTKTLLTDSAASFTLGALAGRMINADTGQCLQSYITSNTATQIEVWGDATSFVSSGDSYKIVDYHIREGSACIDRGTVNPPGGLSATDMDGRQRRVFKSVDIGADEYDPPPRIVEAVYNDKDDDGALEEGESLTLVMNRAVVVSTPTLNVSSFYLPVSGDSLGGMGFGVSLNPNNSRHINLTLGQDVQLTIAGEFSTETLGPGSSSGIDLATGLAPGSILSLTGLDAIDGGVPGVDDWGEDLFFSCVASSATLGAGGGSVQVVVTPDAAYTAHRMTVPTGALGGDVIFTLRPPEENAGVIGAVQIESSLTTETSFSQPVTLTLEYRDSDVDREMGEVEASMKVQQIVEISPGVFDWRPLDGEHEVDLGQRTVSIEIYELDPYGPSPAPAPSPEWNPFHPAPWNGGPPIVMAVLPGSTIEPSTLNIKSSGSGGSPVSLKIRLSPRNGTSPALAPGDDGDYVLHRIEFPGYVETATTDTERIAVTVSPVSLAQRYSEGGCSFPSQSSAIFTVTTRDAFDSPVAFTDPVNVQVQYMDGTVNAYNDLWDFAGAEATKARMRVVHDKIDGTGVNFGFCGASHTFDTGAGTVEAWSVTNLTGASGVGVWGAVAIPYNPDELDAKDWFLYE
ncbi:right-handed parallel beta-helix repeat-containing protein [Candidatus Sumerlaeota bacterium]|nr:right-handed parallel beta-helix repeat-containing protein [Candidatus Sumerlaeota bacterium]